MLQKVDNESVAESGVRCEELLLTVAAKPCSTWLYLAEQVPKKRPELVSSASWHAS